MADEGAFLMQVLSASLAEVANVSVGGTSVMKGEGALLRTSQALYGLVDCLLFSLEEFRDVEHALELEAAGGGIKGRPELPQTSVSVEEARPELLLGVAGALKEMVGTLLSGIKANAQVQKLMPAMQKVSAAKHHAFFQDLMDIPENQQSCSGDVISILREEILVRNSSKDAGTVKRSAGKGQMICKHSCEHHVEVMDPGLWRNLPQELVELTFAKLPLPLIVKLRECSKAWYTMSKTSNFLEACSESHPNLFGLLRWNDADGGLWTTLHDVKSKEWLSVELAGLPGSDTYCRWESANFNHSDEYRNSIYACDGGLVCFVPHEHLTSLPILVCNPLTSIWKTLPLTPLEDFENKEIKMVQLVVDDDTKFYRVILVSWESSEKVISAHFYSSKSGTWSIMEAGLVYGAHDKLSAACPGVPYVFDCTTKTLFDLTHCASLASIDALDYAVAKDHLFVLHASDERRLRSGYPYLVSEFVWESSLSDLRRLNVSESPVQVFPAPYEVMLFASPSFVLLFADNCEKWHEDHHQLIGLYDAAANRWDIPPPVPFGQNIHSEELDRLFMVELRWDINP